MLIVFNDSEHGINLLQSSLNFQQLFLNTWTLCLFRLPVENSPASNIPLVNDAARMEVAEDTLLVFCCHDSKDLQIKLSSDQNPDIFSYASSSTLHPRERVSDS